MKYVIFIFLVSFLIVGILNYMEIEKIRKFKKEKTTCMKLIDSYMKLYWNELPKIIQSLKKEKGIDQKILEKLVLERNHIYDRMYLTEKLIRHTKIEELLKKVSRNKELHFEKLEKIELQIGVVSKEIERLNKEIEKKKSNPFLKMILPFIKL